MGDEIKGRIEVIEAEDGERRSSLRDANYATIKPCVRLIPNSRLQPKPVLVVFIMVCDNIDGYAL